MSSAKAALVVQISGSDSSGYARCFKINICGLGHCQRIGNAAALLFQLLVAFVAQQHMRRLSAICDEHGAVFCGFPGFFAYLPDGLGVYCVGMMLLCW